MNITSTINSQVSNPKKISDNLSYPNEIIVRPTTFDESKTDIYFNILPGRHVKESIVVKKYILNKRKIEAVFDRKYFTDMKKSPSHLIFLSSLVHLQKMIYLYMSYELGYPIKVNSEEHMKIWPTKINVDLPKLITKKNNLTQSIKIIDLKKTTPKSYFGQCLSVIEGKTFISADAAIYLI
tara:strand:+ start:78 stop:620 length:543 start_codon:yes stop_codon:yes gene_type:complete